MTSPYYKVLAQLENHGFTETDIKAAPLIQLGEMVYEFCKHEQIQVAQFKDYRKTRYNLHGYKLNNALLKHKEQIQGQILMAVIHLGEVPLKNPDTVKLARILEQKIIPKDSPARVKLERGLTRNSLIHAHTIYAATEKPPETVRHRGKEYKVETVVVGENPKWNEKYDYPEQVKRSVSYLYKPANAGGTENHSRLDLKYIAYADWFLEQMELHKLTKNQRKKTTNPRLAWTRNTK